MDVKTNSESAAAEVAAEERNGSAPSWQGKRLGRFRLVALLGKGAMGKVFRAHDTTLDRHVALKTLPKVFKTSQYEIAAEQLIREARSAATIEHPHVVQIYEAGEFKGVYYIAMELLEGGSLHDLVKAVGQMDAVRACQLVAEAAEGLDHAHALGIVHRDVKPSNLMLTRGGRCKVVDFGLARVDRASGKFVPLGESVGTPQFLAPEVIQGKAATAQSDIYSLGATLWFLLAGRAPFVGDSKVKTLQMQVSAALPDIRQVRPDLPEGLVLALARAMAKRPEDRFESAGQFAKALRVHTIPVAERAGSGSGLATFAQASGVLAPLERREAASAAVSRQTAMLAAGAGALVIAVVGTFLYLMREPSRAGGAGANSTSGTGTTVSDVRSGGGAERSRIDEAVNRAAAPSQPPPTAPPGAAATGAGVPVSPSPETVAPPAAASLARASSPAGGTVPPAPAPVVAPPSDRLPSVLDATETAALTKIANGGDARYPKREATVQGVVRSAAVSSTGKVCRIEFVGNERQEGFFAAYFPGQFKAMEQKFGGTDGAGLVGQRVRVKGRVEMYQDRPEIKIDSADQVEVVK